MHGNEQPPQPGHPRQPGRPPHGPQPQGQPPQYGPPPQYGSPPVHPQFVAAPKKKGGCLRAFVVGVVVLAGLVLVGVGVLLSGGGDSPRSDTAASPGSDAGTSAPAGEAGKRAAAGIGDTVKDGKFSFKVTKVEKGVERVGDQYIGSNAQGQYVLVHVTVKNIGDEAQMFLDSAQKLLDTADREYDADSGAAVLGLKNSNAFLNNINPGNSVSGILLFDVPDDFRIKAIELHDSLFSDGTQVALR
ncbi:DUF4352 domain-containing protein [Streptosporangium pseudovulgare]|uniref:DUF4352 domain-containing protein n=1 Tax=Streptosporangium pseudovulgare TaxID=35765 RepID=A0ABQ2QW46_9ACTN|nr:DUF4352 domain-containing protein [Streptosporangium pseudovulgare]GGQ00559.1 hypothetical protein GCM10010140_33320 [Streptosporangium pseudovulgare]